MGFRFTTFQNGYDTVENERQGHFLLKPRVFLITKSTFARQA